TWGILFWVALMKGAGKRDLVRRWRDLTRLVPASELGELRTVALYFATLAGHRAVWDDELEGWTVIESRLLRREIEGGELRVGREWPLRLLRVRFPADLTLEVIETINQQPSVSLLGDWHLAAIRASSFDEFLAVPRQ